MLHLLYGPAASGKTDLLMGRIRTAVAARTPGQVGLDAGGRAIEQVQPNNASMCVL